MKPLRKLLSRSDQSLLVREAADLLPNPLRRRFLASAMGAGSLAMLTGCSIIDSDSAERALRHVSSFNDRVQALLFSGNKLAREFPASMITRPFPFNAFYPEKDAPIVEASDYALEVGGLVSDTTPWSLARLALLPQQRQITQLICIEGWSAIGEWNGVPLATFLRRIGADLTARYVGFRCADNYSTSLDMPTALHPQTQMTLRFCGETLPVKYGFPLKVRVPTKLGFKNPKHVVEILVTNELPAGFWEGYGYNWFSGL